MRTGEISVIVPTYNREAILAETLNSLLKQTVPAMEILVVDGGSTDRTVYVAEEFGSPVRVIQHRCNGPGAARNRGLSEARGEYIHFFDSDDIAVPNKHEKQLAILESTGADIAYGPWIKGFISEHTFSPVTKVFQQKGLPGNLLKALLCDWSIVPNACLFRKSIVEKAGGFPEDMILGEDQLMFLNCLLASAKVVHSPGTLELYREGNDDKITANEALAEQRPIEWANFLLRAQRNAQSAGDYPENWFQFRFRAWSAGRDLRKINKNEAKELLEQLALIHGEGKDFPYSIVNWIRIKKRGLQARLLGHRETRSFGMGDLSIIQKELIMKSGYKLNSSNQKR